MPSTALKSPRTLPKRAKRILDTTKTKKKRLKAKKTTKMDVLRHYGLPEGFPSGNLRYKTPIERGILWYWFSLYVRARDRHLPCISCNLMKDDMHGGHFVPAGSASWDDMVFAENNVNAECSWCNKNDKIKLKYEHNLDQKYGAGTAQALKDEFYNFKYNGVKHRNWSRAQLVEKILHYRQKVQE